MSTLLFLWNFLKIHSSFTTYKKIYSIYVHPRKINIQVLKHSVRNIFHFETKKKWKKG